MQATQITEGWGAMYLSDIDPDDDSIGDIYYLSKGRKPKSPEAWKIYWYGRADDGESLELLGDNTSAGASHQNLKVN